VKACTAAAITVSHLVRHEYRRTGIQPQGLGNSCWTYHIYNSM